MLCDLANELISDDGDVRDTRTANRTKCVIDDWAAMKWKQCLVGEACEWQKTCAVATSNENGLDLHGELPK